jgi:hypothetical protein
MSLWEEQKQLADVKIGDWVEANYEYMPGTCSDGGIGVITRLMTTDEGEGTVMTFFATVRYVLDNRKEHSVTMDRFTIISMPALQDVHGAITSTCINASAQAISEVDRKKDAFGLAKMGLDNSQTRKEGMVS